MTGAKFIIDSLRMGGSSVPSPTIFKELTFTYHVGDMERTVVCTVPIPLGKNIQEFAYRVIDEQKIPCHIEKEFMKAMREFVMVESEHFHDAKAEDALKSIKSQESAEHELNRIVSKWTILFTEEHARHAKPEEVQEGAEFYEMYHGLIHSPALETIMNLEHSYALSVEELVSAKDRILDGLQKRQSTEMDKALKNVGISMTDRDINEMAARHFDETEKVTNEWDSRISSLKETQKREFREWVSKVHEDYKSGSGCPGYIQRVRAISSTIPAPDEEEWTNPPQTMEESFTIHLGSQLKMTSNLRLLCADVLDLCRQKPNKIGGALLPQPQRLQTAISLYSNHLCGLVLLVDNRINSYTGIKREFSLVCQRSTEFHFAEPEDQLETIREQAKRAAEWRLANAVVADSSSQSSSGRSSISPLDLQAQSPSLRPGDFYITRHSNLSDVHVVFHLVTNDSLRSADITSRHPVILGLRNILRVAHERDVCTLTIPLLLVHEMAEEMTIPWCLKRAELVFKCVKGFMIEMASLGGEEMRTVQFLVPKGISEELFSNLSSMVPSIFRVSNMLVLK